MCKYKNNFNNSRSNHPPLSHHIHHIMTDPPSTELGMANEDAIARTMNTPTFKKWPALSDDSVLQYGSMHFKKVVDDAKRLEVENKLIACIFLVNENSKKQALQKNKAKRINKISKTPGVPHMIHLEWLQEN